MTCKSARIRITDFKNDLAKIKTYLSVAMISTTEAQYNQCLEVTELGEGGAKEGSLAVYQEIKRKSIENKANE